MDHAVSPVGDFTAPQRGLASRLAVDRPRTAFLCGFAASVVLGWTLWLIVPLLRHGEIGGTEHDGYWALASNLVRGNGYVFEPGGEPVLHRPPLAPVLYAPLTLLPAAWQRPAILLLQSLMIGGVCAALFQLTSRILGVRSARLAVGLMLAYPWLYLHVNLPFSVVAQTFFAVLLVNLVVGAIGAETAQGAPIAGARWRRSATALGLAGAMASLAHGTLIFFALFLLAAMAITATIRRQPRLLGTAVASGCVMAVLISPWTYRNWVVAHQFIPIANNVGFTYFFGVAHWQSGPDDTATDVQQLALKLAGVDEPVDEVVHCWGIRDPSLDAAIGRTMVDHLARHPLQTAKRIVLNTLEYYLPFVHDILRRPHYPPGIARIMCLDRVLLSVWHPVLLILAAVGVWRCRRGPYCWPMLGLACCVVALAWPYCLLVARVRHSHYVLCTLPFLAALASGMVAPRGPAAAEAAPR